MSCRYNLTLGVAIHTEASDKGQVSGPTLGRLTSHFFPMASWWCCNIPISEKSSIVISLIIKTEKTNAESFAVQWNQRQHSAENARGWLYPKTECSKNKYVGVGTEMVRKL